MLHFCLEKKAAKPQTPSELLFFFKLLLFSAGVSPFYFFFVTKSGDLNSNFTEKPKLHTFTSKPFAVIM